MKTPPSLVLRQPIAGLLIPLLIVLMTGAAWTSRSLAQEQIALIDITNTVWRYNDSGNDLGTAWREVNYPLEFTTNWSSGTGMFGVETTSPFPPFYPATIQTPLILGAGRVTYYFRTRFLVAQNPASNIVSVSAYVDDGSVIYVNGVEVQRTRLAPGPVSYTNKAELATPEGAPVNFEIDPARLVLGTNTIAVEVHQQNENSSDVVFGLTMTATGTLAPTILDPDQPEDRTVFEGQSTSFTVVGSGIPAPDYYWFHDNVLIPGANGPTFSIINASCPVVAGNYHVVLSNKLGTATSRTAKLTCVADTNALSILYALARPDDLRSFFVPLSEPPSLSEATDPFNWDVIATDGSGSLTVSFPTITEETNLILSTILPREAGRSYIVVSLFDIPARFGPPLPANTMTPVAAFPVEVVSSSNSWHFERSGTDLGTSWTAPAFSDATWSSGPAPLDVFRSASFTPEPHCRPTGELPTGDRVGTCLNTLSNATGSAQYSTAYFRTRFNFRGDAAHSVLSLTALIDDGAAIYLNGTELARLGLPEGPVAYGTLANRTIGNAFPESLELAARGLVEGENTLAVEVHQVSLLDADLTFGLKVLAIVPSAPSAAAPVLTTSFADGNITISWTPAAGRLQSALDAAGPWNDIEPSAPNPFTEAVSGERKFYRVAVPSP